MLYRIYTEYKNYAALTTLVSKYFDSFCIINTMGYYKGKCEESLIIELGSTEDAALRAKCLAFDIACMNQQECVIVTCVEGERIVYKTTKETITK